MSTECNQERTKSSAFGGFMIIMMLRMVLSTVSAAISVLYAGRLGKAHMIPIFALLCVAAVLSIVLLIMKKKAFRFAYIILSLVSLADFVISQNAMGFMACITVESLVNLYIWTSQRMRQYIPIRDQNTR